MRALHYTHYFWLSLLFVNSFTTSVMRSLCSCNGSKGSCGIAQQEGFLPVSCDGEGLSICQWSSTNGRWLAPREGHLPVVELHWQKPSYSWMLWKTKRFRWGWFDSFWTEGGASCCWNHRIVKICSWCWQCLLLSNCAKHLQASF